MLNVKSELQSTHDDFHKPSLCLMKSTADIHVTDINVWKRAEEKSCRPSYRWIPIFDQKDFRQLGREANFHFHVVQERRFCSRPYVRGRLDHVLACSKAVNIYIIGSNGIWMSTSGPHLGIRPDDRTGHACKIEAHSASYKEINMTFKRLPSSTGL